MDNSIVRVENLSHRYTTQWAIKDINFEINEAGVLGLLGSNGAGKSTTMNIICGVLNQTAGEVYINGINLRENPVEAKKHIGFLPQKPPLYPDLNVDEYLEHCARLRLMEPGKIKDAVEEAKQKCGIAHFSKRLARNLSGGYQQRLGIAQAIIHNPRFVVLDEPTNGLDPNQIVEIRELIKSIAAERSVLISTHILSEVQAMCDHIRMIENGQMVFSGTIEDFDNYIEPNSFVVRYSSEIPGAEGAICEMVGVKRVNNLGEGRYRVQFTPQAGRDITGEVVTMSGRNNWQLSEIALEKVSLDAIFAKLSGKEHISNGIDEQEEEQ